MIKDESGNRRFIGVYRGIVVDNNDPLGKNRLRLQIPQVLLEEETGWAWGVHQVDVVSKTPPVGTAVWVTFEGGDPSFPMWLGSSQELPPSDVPFAVVGGTLETQPTFTGAPLFTGSYVKHGPMVHFRIDVDMDNITNFGSGQYYMNLPFTPKYNYQFTTGCFHDISTGNQYGIGGHVFAGNVQMRLTFTNSNGQDEAFDHNSPVTLNAADNLHISGDYITSE
ncbi:hypothetical protein UFOVP325_111 [uncultured Caudovirales phage]|uniref:Gp5/Type VI secretion system Vgr protein OB-fold domain-containing protein n=1 Tax=uncultured Caudovirales phage TaxID=2100421 RepID=A0A6J5LXN5_9CAUD|nr:hypothetical protein UFOVP325_111 [uncultured Caudovirales phage]CAB4148110.1 hypothetical protein UFOVP430_106 [uncultured Caudovirales phage]